MEYIGEYWSRSKKYRLLLILAATYAVLRLGFQTLLFADVLDPGAVVHGTRVSVDLQQSYIASAQRLQARQDLYSADSLGQVEAYYLYSPAFAIFLSSMLFLPLPSLLALMLIIQVTAYALLYVGWSQIFEQNNLFHIARQWARLLPLYLVFSAFWTDLAYPNMYILIILFGTFLIHALLQEKLGWAVFWLGAVILPLEPYWVFALAFPFLLGRFRFFFKLLAGAALAYLIVASITIAASGFDYGIRQYQDYFGFLTRLAYDYPWRGPDQPFLGYNHSIMQIMLYVLGVSATNMRLAAILKLILLFPLGWIGLRFLRNSSQKPAHEIPGTALALFFVLYLVAVIWLDMIWEFSLGIVIFTYLVATAEQKQTRLLLWIVFGLYALLDIWRLANYLALGERILYQGAYVLTDPLIYIPWIMMILLVFYAILVRKLNKLAMKLH